MMFGLQPPRKKRSAAAVERREVAQVDGRGRAAGQAQVDQPADLPLITEQQVHRMQVTVHNRWFAEWHLTHRLHDVVQPQVELRHSIMAQLQVQAINSLHFFH